MDSAVVTVKKGHPISRDEFLWLSEDGKKEYLAGMLSSGYSEENIADLTGVERPIIHRLREVYRLSGMKQENYEPNILTYKAFCALSENEKRSWLSYVYEKFKMTDGVMAEFWGVARTTVFRLRSKLEIPGNRAHDFDAKGWQSFCCEGIEPCGESHTSEVAEDIPEPEEALYSELYRMQLTLQVHSWEELYNCVKNLPFPEDPIEIRTTSPARFHSFIDYTTYGKNETEE